MDRPPPYPANDEQRAAPAAETMASDASAAASLFACWRCAKDVSIDLPRCPYCDAPLAMETKPEPPPWKSDAQSLVRLLLIYAAMLGVSVLAGLLRYAAATFAPHRHADAGMALAVTLILEAIDTALVVAAWAWCGVRYRESPRPLWSRATAWTLALPMLAAVLAINVAYHHFLRSEFGVAPNPVAAANKGLWAGWIFAICVQPAIVEELFFRYLMFGGLRTVMGGNAVVWVTAVMFAAAHVGVPLSLPVLFVLGLLLGYARLTSGNVYLPVFLHFLHNAVVMALNLAHF